MRIELRQVVYGVNTTSRKRVVYDEYIIDQHPAEWLRERRDRLPNERVHIMCTAPYDGHRLDEHVKWRE